MMLVWTQKLCPGYLPNNQGEKIAMCYICDEAAARKTEVEEKSETKAVPTSRILTREMVMRGNPCWDYRTRFTKRFPESVEVTVDLAVSQSNDWDWDWAGSVLLSRKAARAFRAAVRAADDTFCQRMKPFWDAYNTVVEEGLAVYNKAFSEARAQGQWDNAYGIAAEARAAVTGVAAAAKQAAWEVADKQREGSKARLWALAYLADGDDYAEQHKNDEPFDLEEFDNEDDNDDY